MLAEALEKTVITKNWKIFSKKLFQHFIHHKKILSVRKCQFKTICRSRVLDKTIPLCYIVPLPPSANRVKLPKFSRTKKFKQTEIIIWF